VVDEANDGLRALLEFKGWPWGTSIVTNKSVLEEAWVDLLLKRSNVDLVIIDRSPGVFVCEDAERL
jgi:hypothetical protein